MEDLPSRLLWVDLEMTGLDAAQDRIVELAAAVTDFNLNVLQDYQTGVHQPQGVIDERLKASTWFLDQPKDYQEAIRGLASRGLDQVEVETKVLSMVDKHIKSGPVILAGNSIHKDREFIRQWLPGLEARLHYRMLDVSSWKIYMQGKHGLIYEKKDAHRALEDIYESMAELKFYLAELSGS